MNKQKMPDYVNKEIVATPCFNELTTKFTERVVVIRESKDHQSSYLR
jgi:hypothetical protein